MGYPCIDEDLLDAEIDDVIAAVNDAPHDYLWNDESPLWFRPQYETREIFRADIYKQVVGHTPVERIFEKDGIISTDVFSTYRDGRQIGESAMIVIDSETGKYEKIEVMGKQAHASLTKEQFDKEIEKGMSDVKAGRVFSADVIEAEMKRDFGI